MCNNASDTPWWKSKRIRLDDSCINKSESTLNSSSKNEGRWTYPVNSSLVGAEVMVDLGVSMLADETSCECIKRSENLEKFSLSPLSKESERQSPTNNICNDEKDGIEKIYRRSSFENLPRDRLVEEENNAAVENQATVYNTMDNESGYSSRVDVDVLADKENINNDNPNFGNFSLHKRRKKNSFIEDNKFDKLSDEIILMILKWLSKKCLVRSMLVCKRWSQIARDEALWTRLDLGSKVLTQGTLGHILPRGVHILRLAQAEFADPLFLPGGEIVTKLQYLDLSMSVISPEGLAALLSKCRLLKKLSLEKCTLNESSCEAISLNSDITVLNLTMCEGINETCIKHLVKLKSLNALNVSWCSLDSESIETLCHFLPQSITRLNLSGCRKTLNDAMTRSLVVSCPKLVELDISDCAMVTSITTNNIMNLKYLEHLSVSRCYSIPPSTFMRLAYMQSLKFFDVFGLMKEENLQLLKTTCSETQINKFLYSSVARPTIGVRRTSIWGLRVRD